MSVNDNSNNFYGIGTTVYDPQGGEWTVVGCVQVDFPTVLVLRYETVLNEANWYGHEGFMLADLEGNKLANDRWVFSTRRPTPQQIERTMGASA